MDNLIYIHPRHGCWNIHCDIHSLRRWFKPVITCSHVTSIQNNGYMPMSSVSCSVVNTPTVVGLQQWPACDTTRLEPIRFWQMGLYRIFSTLTTVVGESVSEIQRSRVQNHSPTDKSARSSLAYTQLSVHSDICSCMFYRGVVLVVRIHNSLCYITGTRVTIRWPPCHRCNHNIYGRCVTWNID